MSRYGASWRLLRLLKAEVGLGGIVVVLRLVERLGLVAATFEFVGDSRAHALEVALGLGIIVSLRALATTMLAARARSKLVASAVRGVLSGDVLSGSILPEEDALLGILEGVHNGEWVSSELVPGLLADGVAALVLGAAVLAIVPARLAAAGGAALAVGVVGVVAARRLTAALNRGVEAAFLPVGDALSTAFGARLEIAAAGRAKAFASEAERRIITWSGAAARAERLASLAGRLPLLGTMAVVALAAVFDQTVDGAFTAAALGQAALLASMVPAFAGVSKCAFDLVRAEVKLRPLIDVLEGPRGPVGAPPGTPLPELPADVEWRGVSFSYPSRTHPSRMAVSDLSLRWPKEALLVLKGPNGSGKSTLLRLLLGLARPTSGTVTVGGRDLGDLDLSAWRGRVAFLPQRPFVPERATVREFVRLLATDASDEDIRRVLARLDLFDAVRRASPDAPLDARAGGLSAGERQRLALARALCQDAAVYLLDEPDANLDRAGVNLVCELVRDLARKHMVLVAAHSDEIVAAADRVADLEQSPVTLPPREDNPRSSARA